jgi:enoyl-CoA hydratase
MHSTGPPLGSLPGALAFPGMGEIVDFESPVLRLEAGEEGVATLWLDRPEARNAMGVDLWRDLPRAMAVLSGDSEVRAVVVAAEGPHFSVGLDLKAMGGLLTGGGSGGDGSGGGGGGGGSSMAARARSGRTEVLRLQDAITAVARCPKPVLAAVHGYCIGGGVDLIAACDIRLASADAVFSVREAKMAIVADLGSLQRLPAIIGAGHLAELAFTGKDISAERAKEIGLVNDLAADAEGVHKAAHALALEIAANSPIAVQGTKAVLAANEGRTVAEGLDYVATWNAGMLASDDLTEAVTAFMEKRAPKFTGR